MTPPEAGAAGGRRDLAGLMLGSTLVGTVYAFALPFLALALEARGHGPLVIGLNSAVTSLGVFVVAPFLPVLLARFGALGCIRLGVLVVAAVFLLLPLDDSLPWWFGLRLVLGVGLALPFILCEASVNALVEDDRRGRVMGVYGTLFCAGFACGPLLIALVGTEGVTPFLLAAAILLAALPPLRAARGADAAMAPPTRLRLRAVWRQAPLPLAAILAFGFVETALFALFPVYRLAAGADATAASVELAVLLAGNCLMQIPIGRLADRLPRADLLLACAAIAGLGLGLLPAADAGLVRAALLLVLGGALGGLYTLSLTLLGGRFAGSDLAVANTAFAMMFEAGAVLGPAVAGGAMAVLGPGALIPTLVVGLLGLAGLLGARRRPPPGPGA